MVTMLQEIQSHRPVPSGSMEFGPLALGRKISVLRRNFGYTQKQLAEKTCISVSYIGKLEAGIGIEGLTFSTMTALAQGLDTSESELLSLSDTDILRAKRYAENRTLSKMN